MKKLICILASAALLGACEQKTDVVVPAAPTTDKNAAIDKTTSRARAKAKQDAEAKKDEATNTISTAPAASTEMKTESVTTETKTEPVATPNQ